MRTSTSSFAGSRFGMSASSTTSRAEPHRLRIAARIVSVASIAAAIAVIVSLLYYVSLWRKLRLRRKLVKAMATRSRTRKPLSRERVLEKAIALADKDGIETLSMRKLGQALG